MILRRYIAWTLIRMTLLVFFILICVQIFIAFLNQLSDIGQGDYGIWQAFKYIALDLTMAVYGFFPIAALLGGLLGLGLLSHQNELTVMQISGMSTRSLLFAVLWGAFILAIGIAILGESIGPYTQQQANTQKLLEMSQGKIMATHEGIWIRAGDWFLHIGQINNGQEAKDIVGYYFQNHRLDSSYQAPYGIYKSSLLQMKEVQQTLFYPDKTQTHFLKELILPIPIAPHLLSKNTQKTEEMSLFALNEYYQYNQSNHIKNDAYSYTLWKRIFDPFCTILMLLFSVALILGPLYQTNKNTRFTVGLLTGFSFYIINQFLTPLVVVYQISPILGAILPSMILLFGTIFLLFKYQ